jgi:lipid-A-disaccharide synthase
MIIAGEPSGDLLAGLLLEQLRIRRPSWSFFGIGGPRMTQQGFEQIVGIEDLSVIGFADVARKFFFFRRVFSRMLKQLEQRRPDAVILVDYPGFNLRFACRATRDGFRTLYYIAPQVWAWDEGRIEKLRRCVDLLVPVFPFEQEYFQSRGVNTRRVGHPLLDIVRPARDRESFCRHLSVSSAKKLIALLPGSRTAEVQRHLPIMLAAVEILARDDRGIFPVIARAPGIGERIIREITADFGALAPLVSDDTYSAVAAADLALVKSGTATTECAMLGTPFIVMYKTGAINYRIARRLIRTRHIAMANLVAGKSVVPEFIQNDATPENLARAGEKLLAGDEYRQDMIDNLFRIRERLGPPSGAAQAADIVIDWLEGSNNQ